MVNSPIMAIAGAECLSPSWGLNLNLKRKRADLAAPTARPEGEDMLGLVTLIYWPCRRWFYALLRSARSLLCVS